MSINNKSDVLKDWRRSVAVKTVAGLGDRDHAQAAQRLYGAEGASAVLKAAVNPASTEGWGGLLVETRVGAFLKALRPKSAAAILFEASPRLSLTGLRSISLPRLAAEFPAPAWVAEGGSIPVLMGAFGATLLGPPKKMAAIAAISGELATYSAETAETIIEQVVLDATARALDVSLFSNAAASATRPAGLLNGVTALTAATSGGADAMRADIKKLYAAIAAVGGGANVFVFASPELAVAAAIIAGANLPVYPAAALAAGTVVAVEAGAFVSGFDDVPEVEIAPQATLVMDDAAGAFSTAGTPNTVAAGIRDNFQTDTRSLRVMLRAAWTNRLPGSAQFITGANW